MTSLSTRTLPNSGTSPSRPIAQGALRSVVRLLAVPVRAYRAWRDTEHVMGFSDHLLKDIGIARCEIDAAVRREPPR